MGKTREWLDGPLWAGRSSVAERGVISPEFFSPPTPARAASCSLYYLARALAEAAGASGVRPEELLVLSSLRREPDPFDALSCYRVRGLGGRALPFAAGAAAARRSTRIVCVLSAARGATLGWLQEAARGKLDACVLVVNGGACRNAASAAPDAGLVESSIRSGAGFAARLAPSDDRAAEVLGRALRHRGLSVVDAVSLCPAHDEEEAAERFKKSCHAIEEVGHDAASFDAAVEKAREPLDAAPVGVFFDCPDAGVMSRGAGEASALRQSEHERLWSALR
jgi:pyruvate/2-oxoacid:ferredoxin oxidoreductase beta subunit